MAKDRALVKHNSRKENKHKRHSDLSRGSAKYNTCLLHVVASQWTRVALNPSQVIQWSTWIPRCFFLLLFPVYEESPQLGASRPYNWWSQRSMKVRMGRATHTRLKARAQSRTQATTWAHNTTQRVLYSNGAQITITKNRMRENEVLVLRNDQWMLGWLLHVPRGPFYSPNVARSRWRHSWKAILAFCRVAHHTVWCTTGYPLFIVWCRSPSQNGTADRCRNVAVGAPDTVRCPSRPLAGATRHARIARPIVALAAVGSPDSSVNYSHMPPMNSWEWPVHQNQPGAPDTVRCTQTEQQLAVHSQLFSNPFLFLILALRQIY
jgi:hypothetical protein